MLNRVESWALAPSPDLPVLPLATSCESSACCCVRARPSCWTWYGPRPSLCSPPVRVSGAQKPWAAACGGGGHPASTSIVTGIQLTDHHPGCEAHAVHAHTHTYLCAHRHACAHTYAHVCVHTHPMHVQTHTHPAHAHSCMHTSVSEGVRARNLDGPGHRSAVRLCWGHTQEMPSLSWP